MRTRLIGAVVGATALAVTGAPAHAQSQTCVPSTTVCVTGVDERVEATRALAESTVHRVETAPEWAPVLVADAQAAAGVIVDEYVAPTVGPLYATVIGPVQQGLAAARDTTDPVIQFGTETPTEACVDAGGPPVCVVGIPRPVGVADATLCANAYSAYRTVRRC